MPKTTSKMSSTSHGQNAQSLLTIKEVAALDGVSEKTVRRAISAGQLKALRIGPAGRLLRITRGAHALYRAAGEL